MLTLQRAISHGENDHDHDHDHNHNHNHRDDDDDEHIRDIHALTPPRPPRPRPSSLSSEVPSSDQNFSTMNIEFNALNLAAAISSIENNDSDSLRTLNSHNQYSTRIGEDQEVQTEETNPLALVLDNNPFEQGLDQQRRAGGGAAGSGGPLLAASSSSSHGEVSVLRVKKEEVDSKICAWQNAKVAKFNNRFKREESVINGWESEQVQKATSWMKKVERKLEEKRVRALEKMQNEVAKAHRKAEERRASAEAKRGTKVARVLEIANLMRAVGRPPAKRSFF